MKIWITSLLLLSSTLVFGQKVYTAQRLKSDIKLDGVLDESDWSGDYAGEFQQFEPNFNAAPSLTSKVYIRYDDDAIYIGANLIDDEPNLILKELANRDEGSNTDAFAITFDTYRDGINAFAFIVTAAGVQKDSKFSSEGEDQSWDGVWQSKVQLTEQGWSVEMKIPYNVVRFSEAEEQVWGMQISREIRRFREIDLWNPADPNIDGFVNQFGILKGISNIKTPFRLSITPYLSGYYNASFNPQEEGSLESGTAYSAGLDLKLGLSDAFTLDMTLVPDFGQTISDNQVLNLGPFEVFFEENRPFFTEGLELFNKGRLFYTRRVGGTPVNYFAPYNQLSDNEVVTNNPNATSLINATKVSGRMGSGTGIGLFNGVTAEEYATITDTVSNLNRSVQTSPYSNFNVFVVDQTFKNNSFVTLMNTNVTRFGDTYDANTTGVFGAINDKDQKFGARGSFAYSNQYSPEDNNTGFTYNAEVGKYSGEWTYSLVHVAESPNYNPNDLGFLFSPNEFGFGAELNYNQYSPKHDLLQLYRYGGGIEYGTLYTPRAYNSMGVYFNNFWLMKSRNAFGYSFNWRPMGEHDYFEPRKSDFSTFLAIPASAGFDGFFSSDYRKVLAVDLNWDIQKYNEQDRVDYEFEIRPRVRFNDKISLTVSSEIGWQNGNQGFVNRFYAGQDVLGGNANDVLIGSRDRQRLTNTISARYIFTNRMGLNLRVRHYWDKVEYLKYLRLSDEGALSQTDITGINDEGESIYNRNRNFFNVDMQYQWRFAPGSDLFIVWKMNIAREDDAYNENYFTNVGNLFNDIQNNSISLRAVYFMDYNRFF